MFETVKDQQETLRWAVLATHLNGAADTRKYDHIDTTAIVHHVQDGDIFEFLSTELGPDVDDALRKLTDVQRHMLLKHWRTMARYWPKRSSVSICKRKVSFADGFSDIPRSFPKSEGLPITF